MRELSTEDLDHIAWDEPPDDIVVVGSFEVDTSRWHHRMVTVFHEKGLPEELWGVDWRMGLTECQEHMMPSEEGEAPYRVEAHTVSKTEYRAIKETK